MGSQCSTVQALKGYEEREQDGQRPGQRDQALSYACDNVHVELEEVIGDAGRKVSLYDKKGTLWPQIEQQTADCQTTIEERSLLVSRNREEGSIFFKQGIRQIKKNSYEDDFAKICVRIHSHTQSLQAVLLVVNMC